MKLHKILRMTQERLFSTICQVYPQATVAEGEYIFVPGTMPVMFVAHLDTVHKESVKHICTSNSGNIIMSPQGIGGDDRCGVYALMKLWKAVSGKHPSLLFTCNEETGGHGAKAFAADWKNGLYEGFTFKYLIELDRRGKKDAVFYNCANDQFEDYVQSFGFCTDFGTYTDICDVAPAIGVAAVNLSCGYYNAHTLNEYIKVNELQLTINKVRKMLQDIDNAPVFEYVDWYDSYDSYSLYDYEDSVIECELCGETHRAVSMYFVEGSLLCEDCVRYYCRRCADCNKYTFSTHNVPVMGGSVEVCDDCYEEYEQ